MWVPGVDVEKEVLLVVQLQPLARPHHRPGDVVVRLGPPPRSDVPRLVVTDVVDPGARAFLTLDGEERLEADVVVHAVAPVEGHIADRRRVVAVFGEHMTKRLDVVSERLPTHERHRPAPGAVVGPRRHRGECSDVMAIEPGGTSSQRIEGRGDDAGISVRSQVVPSERVRHDPDDVHQGLLPSIGRAMIALASTSTLSIIDPSPPECARMRTEC